MNKLYSSDESPKTNNSLKNKCVFLIDNDNVCNYMNERLIENEMGAKVMVFKDPDLALKKLQLWSDKGWVQKPDVIFLDLHMPQMSGWQFLKEFLKFNEEMVENCSVYILSASTHVYDIQKTKKIKLVKKYIIKPLNAEKLKELVLI